MPRGSWCASSASTRGGRPCCRRRAESCGRESRKHGGASKVLGALLASSWASPVGPRLVGMLASGWEGHPRRFPVAI
jgi:hypothetical protein